MTSSAALAICFSMLSSGGLADSLLDWVAFSCCRLCLSNSCFCCLDNCICHAPSSAVVSSVTSLVFSDSSSRLSALVFFFFGDRDGWFSVTSWLLLLVVRAVVSLTSVTSSAVGLGDYKKIVNFEIALVTHVFTCWGFVRCLGFFLFSLTSTTGAGVSIIIGAGFEPLPVRVDTHTLIVYGTLLFTKHCSTP